MEESKAHHTSLICTTVRIGSYKYASKERVIISESGIKLEVPLPENSTNFVSLEIKFENIVKVLIHFGKAMPVLFFYTTTNAGCMIRELLRMQDPDGVYYDPDGKDQSQKRITLLPEVINEGSKLILKALFAPNKLLEELQSRDANNILVRSSPKNVSNYYLYFTFIWSVNLLVEFISHNIIVRKKHFLEENWPKVDLISIKIKKFNRFNLPSADAYSDRNPD